MLIIIFTAGMIISPFLILLVIIAVDNCQSLTISVKEFLGVVRCLIWGNWEMQEQDYLSHHYYTVVDAERMDLLIRELIKIRYCNEVLGNSPVTKEAYMQKIKFLAKLETKNPRFVKRYSPTQYNGFREDMAQEAYGNYWHDDWDAIKRTLWLTKENTGLKDDPSVIIQPADNYGF